MAPRASTDSFRARHFDDLPPLVDLKALARDDGEVVHVGQYRQALLATAVFRIWGQLTLLTLWATAVTLVNRFTDVPFSIPSTLLTVLGTMIAFVISYRTSSAYDRYWEGRRLWSTVVFASRIWARTVWIACPDSLSEKPIADPEDRERDAVMAVVEKKTMVNLVQAFNIALKHYLRGEDGYYYEDLWPLVRYLPGYSLPSSIPDPLDERFGPERFSADEERALSKVPYVHPAGSTSSQDDDKDSCGHDREATLQASGAPTSSVPVPTLTVNGSSSGFSTDNHTTRRRPTTGASRGTHHGAHPTPRLRPARNPPPPARLRDLFPFSLVAKRGSRADDLEMAAYQRQKVADAKKGESSSNVPFELTLYMGSFIATLTKRNTADVPTRTSLLNALLSLTDCLTGLERILTTPIPFSYAAHLWMITYAYCILLPFQIYTSLGWVTIPATTLVAFLLCGFLSIGNEIERPFDYDRNDLDLDQFNRIVRAELAAITSRPMSTTNDWVFVAENDHLFGANGGCKSAVDLAKTDMSTLRRALGAQGGRPYVPERAPASSQREQGTTGPGLQVRKEQRGGEGAGPEAE